MWRALCNLNPPIGATYVRRAANLPEYRMNMLVYSGPNRFKKRETIAPGHIH